MNSLILLQEFGNCLRTPTPETLDQAEILARRSLEIVESLGEFPLQEQSVELLKSVYTKDLPKLRSSLPLQEEAEIHTQFRSLMASISEGIRLAVEYSIMPSAEAQPSIDRQQVA